MIELAFAFKEKGHSVSFLTYHHIPFFNSMVENEMISITCIKEPNYIKRLFKMRYFIRHGRYDAVLSFLEGANFICEFSGIPFRKWKLVVGERSANPGIMRSIKLKFYRWFHFFANDIVANSKANMDLVLSANPLLPRSRCHIIYNMVDFNRFRPADNYVHRQNRKTLLLIAARINHEKNVTGLIESLSLLNMEDQNRLKIEWYGGNEQQSGSNQLLNDSLALIRRMGVENIISFHEATPDITGIIQQSDAVGLFSYYEGFPNFICEAMACEKPVVCTRVSDMTAFLSHDPNLLCDPRDPHSIKKALSYLINLDSTLLREIGIQNRKVALEKFEREGIISSYLHLLGN